MRKIPVNKVHKWIKVGKIVTPKALSTTCPHCAEKVILACVNHQLDEQRACVASSAICPGCSHHVGVWSFGFHGPESAEVFIHPNHNEPHVVKEVSSFLSEPLFRSYNSTVDAYNTGNYVATAVCCRRTLEGIFHDLLPNENKVGNLAKAIEKVAETVDLSMPIRNLANVLRHGGNLGAHFDMVKEPDEEMAYQMLLLLENLIEFLHVLPVEISSLEKLLDKEA